MKTDYQIDIITRIKKFREDKGISQAQMAKILNISAGQMGNIERYNMSHKYTLKQLTEICKALGIGMADIFATKGNMTLDTFIDCLIKYQMNS